MVEKRYKRTYDPNKNVLEAANERIAFIFREFEKIYLSFSGGKDSGVMLNLTLDYMRRNNIKKKIGLMVLDNEANYTQSLDFMHSIVEKNLDLLDVHWCCLPITLPCLVSAYELDWQCWGEKDRERWIRPMPDKPYIVNLQNHKYPFFRENMEYQEFWDKFGDWYSEGKRTACMIGIRTSESLNRFRAIMNEDKEMLHNQFWTKKNGPSIYNVYPIYDWKCSDIWKANHDFEWEYNKLYDLFYKSGVPIGKMRVASPFMSESKSSLNMYRVIDPTTWTNLCSRVSGANFMATYGKQITYSSFELPKGHTWKSFVKFLLATLPEETAANFKRRFVQSIKFWARTGRGLPQKVIQELFTTSTKVRLNGVTPHGGNSLNRVRVIGVPDHLDQLSCHNSDVISWKRFAITILKNDHTCKYLGLAPTKEQMLRQKEIQRKYSKL